MEHSTGLSAAELVESLADTTRPSFLFGCTPPVLETDARAAGEIAGKFAERGRVLAIDGYIVYDVQDETSRNADKRPFPYRKLMDPATYARLLADASHKGCIVYKVPGMCESREAFVEWLDDCKHVHGHQAVNIVGAPSSSAELKGPSTKEASEICTGKPGMRFGAVCIAERHLSKGDEHVQLSKKAGWGAEWFVTQGIYEPAAMIAVIKAYAKLCADKGEAPRKIILTFTPIGRKKTLEFARWLGMNIPAAVEERIFADQSAVKTPVPAVELACRLLCEHLRTILDQTRFCGVPLGINVESISGYKDEIDGTHELFRNLQAIMLDSFCRAWVIKWSRLALPPIRPSASHKSLPDRPESPAGAQGTPCGTRSSTPVPPSRPASALSHAATAPMASAEDLDRRNWALLATSAGLAAAVGFFAGALLSARR